jgi:tRNA threonylcarbamoyl adenosine modification protein YeaZ
MRGEREERLMPAVAGALADAGIAPNAIDRVVCGAGPGSFTSLRIAGAIAKGLALAAGVPLIPVSSLLLIVAGAEPQLAPAATWPCSTRCVATCSRGVRGDRFIDLDRVAPTIVPRGLLDAFAHHAARAIGPAERLPSHRTREGSRSWDIESMAGARRSCDVGARVRPPRGGQVRWEAAHGRACAPMTDASRRYGGDAPPAPPRDPGGAARRLSTPSQRSSGGRSAIRGPPTRFRALFGNPLVHFAVAEDAITGVVLGYVVAWFVVDEAEIANLAVSDQARTPVSGRVSWTTRSPRGAAAVPRRVSRGAGIQRRAPCAVRVARLRGGRQALEVLP